MKQKLLFLLVLLLTAATGAVAEEQVVYTLDGTQTASNTAYATAGVVNQGGMTWYVTGNVHENPWRIGGKSLSGEDRRVWSENSLDETVTKVTLEFGEANSITVNSITMTVASDAEFSDVIDTKAVTFSANNTVDVTPTEGKVWKDAYYRFVFNVTVSGSSNKFLQLKSIKFYNDPDAQQQGGSSTEPVAGTFTVSLKDGVKDADKWTVSPAANVKKGTEVTVTYSGTKKVIGVKAEKKAPAVTVTWNYDDITGTGKSFTKDGVTITAGNIDFSQKNFMQGGTFTTTLGNFTKIEVSGGNCTASGEGWSGDNTKKTWTGNASSVSFSGKIHGNGEGTLKFVFTIEPTN